MWDFFGGRMFFFLGNFEVVYGAFECFFSKFLYGF